ncbi:Uncharacterized protein FWK35_00008727 [Aphis craccivora]|uniref:Uncharacterized protein n=1 Tax=Aphis craccivora TaxID=307492 RepID=A0A6G0YTP5_APHCR|nr:Uncharacterized protein FWK35_00008727 [Aphis craccivora]
MLQFQTMVVSDVKVNILVFKKIEKNKKKNDGKTGIFTQNQFLTKLIFFGCNSKTNHCKYLKFSPNVYVSVIYIHVTSRNNAPTSNFGGGFRCKSEYPWCIIEVKS